LELQQSVVSSQYSAVLEPWRRRAALLNYSFATSICLAITWQLADSSEPERFDGRLEFLPL